VRFIQNKQKQQSKC